MLVDDDADAQLIFSGILEHHGWLTTVFGTAQTAIDYLTQTPLPPDLVLLDLYLPDRDGYLTLQSLRAIQPTLKVVATTAYYTDETAPRVQEAGFDGFLTKPVSSKSLVTYLTRILG